MAWWTIWIFMSFLCYNTRPRMIFLPNLKKNFFQNCIKLIENYFLTDFNDFIEKKYFYIFFIRVPPFWFFFMQNFKKKFSSETASNWLKTVFYDFKKKKNFFNFFIRVLMIFFRDLRIIKYMFSMILRGKKVFEFWDGRGLKVF
jgi:hypothetical protein